MITASTGLGHHPHGGGHGGGGFRRGGGRGFWPGYVQPIYVTPQVCTMRPNPIPPCNGTLVWLDANTVCCR